MKRKQEPARRSGRLAAKSTRISSPPVREFDQPIPCDSCSSNVPSQQRRNCRLKLKAMDNTHSQSHEENTKARKQHSWEHEEEMMLLNYARTLNKELPYQKHKAAFHARLGEMMNEHYSTAWFHDFNERKIRGKLECYEKRWYEQAGFEHKVVLSAKRLPLDDFYDVFSSLFGEARETVPRKRTSTGVLKSSSTDVLKSSSTVDKNFSIPADKASALAYLCTHSKCVAEKKSMETLMFSYMLEDKGVLDAFVAHAQQSESYLERRKFLADLKKKGAVKIPQLEGIDPRELPQDFR